MKWQKSSVKRSMSRCFRNESVTANASRRARMRSLHLEQLEERTLLTCGNTFALFVNGLAGPDSAVPTQVIDELVRLGYTGNGVGTNGLLADWNNLGSHGGPGAGAFPSVSIDSVQTIPDIPTPFGTIEIPDIPTGITFSIVDIGTPNTNNQIISDVVNQLNNFSDNDTIILIGHSLGGDTVLKIVEQTTVEIDLLAFLDPVGFIPRPDELDSIPIPGLSFPTFPGFPSIPGFGGGALGVSIDVPDNDNGEVPGFFIGSNLDGSVPGNVKYLYNRWQSNSPFPIDFLVSKVDESQRQLDGSAQKSLASDFGISDQSPQDSKTPSYYLWDGGPLNRLAILAPEDIDINPFSTTTFTVPNLIPPFIPPEIDVEVPTGLNEDFFKTDSQLHHDFPQNSSVQQDIIQILRAITPAAQPDRFEENDSVGDAVVLGSQPQVILTDLTIHEATDVDVFQVTANETGKLVITVHGRSTSIGLRVRDEFGNSIATTTGPTLVLPTVGQEGYFVEIFSTNNGIFCYALEIENFLAPIPDGGFLDPASDVGRSNSDNITKITQPQMFILADVLNFVDTNHNDIRDVGEIRALTAAQVNAGNTGGAAIQVWLTNISTHTTVKGYADPLDTSNPSIYNFTPEVPLPDGTYIARAATWIFDDQRDANNLPAPVSGRTLLSAPLLQFTVDTVAPSVDFGHILVADDGLDPASDAGVAGPLNAATFTDRITNDTAPTFFGIAESNAIIQAWVDTNGNNFINVLDDEPLGETVTIPLDGNIYGEGFWKITSILDMNDPRVSATIDGHRRILLQAEDLAGNIGGLVLDDQEPTNLALDIFIDTQGPQIRGVHLPDDPGTLLVDESQFDLFSPKPSSGPTPPVRQLVLDVKDLPNRLAEDFLYDALVKDIAENGGHYVLVGDSVGVIPIQNISYALNPNPPADGQPATGTLTLLFAEPLPDDRYTLSLSDALVDPAGNRLDGESNALQPLDDPKFPSGDGVAGGDFVARFTVDSRPEIGVTAATRIYVDINGNFIYDSAGSGDETNRDLIFQFGYVSDDLNGQVSDAYFAGNFNAAGSDPASEFDKLGAFGWDPYVQKYRFLLDFNHNGVADFMSYANISRSALPVAGDFVATHPGDEIGLFTGDTWYLDKNGDNVIDVNVDTVIPTSMRGIPVVGDVNGDGSDDLITYDAGTDTFYIDLNRNGKVNDTIRFGIPDYVERPVVGDLNLDGVDDLGLWVAGNEQKIGEGKAEWYFLVSDRLATQPNGDAEAEPNALASALFDPYSPDPLGNDLFANFGDRYSLPIFGNFDPPVAGGDGASGGHLISYTNANLPLDVNDDGVISPIDALLVIDHLNVIGSTAMPAMMVEYEDAAPFVDVSGDRFVSPIDVLLVIDHLNQPAGGDGEGEAVGVEGTLAGDSAGADLVLDSFAVVGFSGHAIPASPCISEDAVGGTTDFAPTPVSTVTPLLIGQPENQRSAISDIDEWLEDDTDLEDVLELIADQVQSNWWDAT